MTDGDESANQERGFTGNTGQQPGMDDPSTVPDGPRSPGDVPPAGMSGTTSQGTTTGTGAGIPVDSPLADDVGDIIGTEE